MSHMCVWGGVFVWVCVGVCVGVGVNHLMAGPRAQEGDVSLDIAQHRKRARAGGGMSEYRVVTLPHCRAGGGEGAGCRAG